MYRRYTVPYKNGNTNLPQGILGAAFKLARSGDMNIADEELLLASLQLFQNELPTPNVFDVERNKLAISWFKEGKNQFSDAIEEVKSIVENYLSPVSIHETDSIGEVIYEDQYQILAIP